MQNGFLDGLLTKMDRLGNRMRGETAQERLNLRLEKAVRLGHIARAAQALADGAESDAPFPRRMAEGDALRGYTPLAAAVKLGDAAMADMLLMYNADTEARNETEGRETALGVAVKANSLPMVQKLLAMGASAEATITEPHPFRHFPSGKKRYRQTPLLHYADTNGMADMAALLDAAIPKSPLPVFVPAPAPLTAAEIAQAFRDTCCKGTQAPLAKPKTASFRNMTVQ